MKALAEFTKLRPDDRMKRTNTHADRISQISEKSHNVAVGKCIVTKGLDLSKLDIQADNNERLMTKDGNFMGFRRPLLSRRDLKENAWVLVYWKKNYDQAGELFELLIKSSKDYGIKVYEPLWVELDDRDNADKAIQKIKSELKSI